MMDERRVSGSDELVGLTREAGYPLAEEIRADRMHEEFRTEPQGREHVRGPAAVLRLGEEDATRLSMAYRFDSEV